MNPEAMLAALYAAFLIAVAAGLEAVARRSHRRSENITVAGFRYQAKLDEWRCPQEQTLARAETDYARRVVVYRAPAHVCNACPIKTRCTDSDQGRTIEQAQDSWLQSELRRFHRGISLALFALATLIVAVELFRSAVRIERVLLAGMLVAIAAAGGRLMVSFRERHAEPK